MIHVGGLGVVQLCTTCADQVRADPVVRLARGVLGLALPEVAREGQVPTVVGEVAPDSVLDLVACYGCDDTRTIVRWPTRLLLATDQILLSMHAPDARRIDLAESGKAGRVVMRKA